MTPFDIVTAPLEPGITLIEASAGTGKTHSITGLFLRLILEQHLTVRQILAVTFTEAATEELRDRVRSRLHQALADLRRGKADDDEIVAAFLKQGNVQAGIKELDLALQSFDEAQIFTIHGFCQRMLTDHAFESGARFETALLTDPTPLFQEVARDFWRLRFYRATPVLPILALAWQKSPDDWVKLLEQTRRHPDLVVIPALESKSCDDLLREIERIYGELTTEWSRQTLEIERLLRTDGNLSQSAENFRDDRVTKILTQVADACRGLMLAAPENIPAFRELSSEAIAAGTLSKRVPPSHPFFALCSDFQKTIDALFAQLTHDFLAYADEQLSKRKAESNTVTYDDLITGLRNALRQEGGHILARRIGERYSAAMIDEFQDTDPAQYEIARTIFQTDKHRLFFIGDPKQAIYGFRGADVFTYFDAAQLATRKFTLTTNWRSEEGLLAAINGLFTQAHEPFVLEWIQYREVHFPPKPKVRPLKIRDDEKALNVRLFESSKDRELICCSVGRDIAALHASEAKIGERRLCYSDMAVLVRWYSQANDVQETLRAQGIRCIIQSDQSVFASKEARELQQFLQGVIDPRRDPQLKAALATSLIGFDAEALLDFDQNDQKRQTWLDRFARWRQLWINGCFMATFRDFVATQDVRARIVSLPAGERRLTNFLHLAELLHDAESAGSLAPDALCSWLRQQRESKRAAQDRFQLRLESDEDAVQIVTVHRSKGLEYPIVFCPFLWAKTEISVHQELLFHDRTSNNRLTFDLRGKSGGSEQHLEWQSEETTAEELRLLYVAVTRARNRCYLYLPKKVDKSSPLARLLQPSDRESAVDRINTLAASHSDCVNVSVVDPEEMESSRRVPEGTTTTTLSARPFAQRIPRVAITASFSGLNVIETEPEETEPELVEQAPSPIPAGPDESDLSIFTFDRGRRTGDFFHDVLEQMDFQNPHRLSELIDSKLGLYGFARTSHRPAINQLLAQLREIELEPGMRFRDVSMKDRIAECDFCYPLAHLTPAVLAKNVSRWKSVSADVRSRIGNLSFNPVEGFLRGIVDLLFRFNNRYYLVDWKSNWLGYQPSDYGIDGMQREMLKHNYYLQYHLYILAMDLFLERRVPNYSYDNHFGGVFYIFLRGIDPSDSSRGIFRDRPALKTVESLRKLIS